MCYRALLTFAGCAASILWYEFCLAHIEHTRLQLDNNPCPDDVLIERHIKDSDCDCSTSGEECGNDNGDEKGVSYHFEKPDDRYRKFGRTALLAQAERDRLAAEQKEIEAEDERKQAVAEFMKKRRRVGITVAELEALGEGVRTIQVEDVDMDAAAENAAGGEGITEGENSTREEDSAEENNTGSGDTTEEENSTDGGEISTDEENDSA